MCGIRKMLCHLLAHDRTAGLNKICMWVRRAEHTTHTQTRLENVCKQKHWEIKYANGTPQISSIIRDLLELEIIVPPNQIREAYVLHILVIHMHGMCTATSLYLYLRLMYYDTVDMLHVHCTNTLCARKATLTHFWKFICLNLVVYLCLFVRSTVTMSPNPGLYFYFTMHKRFFDYIRRIGEKIVS